MTLSAPVLERPSDGSIKYINPKSTQPNPNPTPTPIPTPKIKIIQIIFEKNNKDFNEFWGN